MMPSRRSESAQLADALVTACGAGRRRLRVQRLCARGAAWKRPLPPGAHLHDTWELKVVVRGTMRHTMSSGRARIGAPTVLVVPPRTVHVMTLPSDLSNARGLLVVAPSAGGHLVAMGTGRDRVQRVLDRARQDVLSEVLGMSWERFVAGCLGEPDGGASDALREHFDAKTTAFLAALAVVLQKDAVEPVEAAGAMLVARAMDLLNKRCHDPRLTVAEVARALRRSPTHLASVFRARTGAGVRAALVGIRLERARRLLEAGYYVVKEVARLTGWSNQQHFSTSYRTRFGFPPSHTARSARRDAKRPRR
jgi:AraC-like DNA-binding protein